MKFRLPILHRKDPDTMTLATTMGIIFLSYLWVLQFATLLTGTSLIGSEDQELDLFASLMFTLMAPMIVIFMLLWAKRTNVSTSFVVGAPLPMVGATWVCLGNMAAHDVTGDAQFFLLIPLTYAAWLLRRRPAIFVLCYIVVVNGLTVWYVEQSAPKAFWTMFVSFLFYVAFTSLVVAIRDRSAMLEEEFYSQSQTDSLTGLYNRFVLNKRMRTAMTYHKSFALAIIDIDNFKTINDTWGHLNGDLVLQAVTSILENTLDTQDTAARLGGDELALIIVDVNEQEALERCQRIVDNVRAANIMTLEDDIQMDVTVSIGVSHVPLHVKRELDSYRASDLALYNAKTGGRNQAVLFNPQTMSLSDEPDHALEDHSATSHLLDAAEHTEELMAEMASRRGDSDALHGMPQAFVTAKEEARAHAQRDVSVTQPTSSAGGAMDGLAYDAPPVQQVMEENIQEAINPDIEAFRKAATAFSDSLSTPTVEHKRAETPSTGTGAASTPPHVTSIRATHENKLLQVSVLGTIRLGAIETPKPRMVERRRGPRAQAEHQAPLPDRRRGPRAGS